MRVDQRSSVTASPTDLPWLWQGTEAWTVDDGQWQPWRLPPGAGPVRLGRLAEKARMAAGVRGVVDTDASAFELTLCAADERIRPLDVVVDGQLFLRRQLQQGFQRLAVDLPPGDHRVEIWLPQFGEVTVSPLTLHGVSHLTPPPAPPRQLGVYGSSITHGRQADGPTDIWSAVVARQKGWGLRCWGFGGDCHLDPVVATTIARAQSDLIVLCLGANIHAEASFNARTLPPHVAGFLDTVRSGHPDTPILVMSTIGSPARQDRANDVGLSMGAIRQIIEASVEELISAGDRDLHLLSGLDVLGLDEADQLIDEVHPGSHGHHTIGVRVADHLDRLGLG